MPQQIDFTVTCRATLRCDACDGEGFFTPSPWMASEVCYQCNGTGIDVCNNENHITLVIRDSEDGYILGEWLQCQKCGVNIDEHVEDAFNELVDQLGEFVLNRDG